MNRAVSLQSRATLALLENPTSRDGAFWISSEFVSAAIVSRKCRRTRVSSILKCSETPCYVGLKRVEEDTYDEVGNPDGVIRLGLAKTSYHWIWLRIRLLRMQKKL